VKAQRVGFGYLGRREWFGRFGLGVGPASSYVSQAEIALPEGNPWVDNVRAEKANVKALLSKCASRTNKLAARSPKPFKG